MMFISEAIIENITTHLEQANFEIEVEKFGKKQPALMAYIFSEDFELLTQDEREYMLYLMLVIWQSVEKVKGNLIPTTKKKLEEAEENNWELLENVIATNFRDRMTVFFENSNQEDLLAFIEDALVADDEDNVVTKEGREPMFIALKSVVDVLTA
jgi:hypothetical protein